VTAAGLSQLHSANQQVRLENEKNLSDQDAHNQGYSLQFLDNYPNAFKNSLSEDGRIAKIGFDNPYLLDKLNTAYANGIWARLKKYLLPSGAIAGVKEIFIKQAYEAGANGKKAFNFAVSLSIPDKHIFTTDSYAAAFSEDDKTGKIQVVQRPLFVLQEITDAYEKGLDAYLKSVNTKEAIENRVRVHQEARKQATVGKVASKASEGVKAFIVSGLGGGLCGLMLSIPVWVISHFFFGADWTLVGIIETCAVSFAVIGLLIALIS
jgi:hypothetical protein